MTTYTNPTPSVDYPVIPKKVDKSLVNNYNENNSIYYAFLDVLGFKQIFHDNKQSPDSSFAKRFEDVFTYYFDLMNSANFMLSSGNLCYAGQISDSLYFYTDREDYLIEFLKIFSHINIYAMTQDVFFRGGVAKGSLYYKQRHQFYGESVINAYLLESEISKNPVIVIDENTFQAIKAIPDSAALISYERSRHLIRPFAFLENNFVLDVDQYKIKKLNIDSIPKIIGKNKSKFEYDAKNYDKYVFLSDQFDNMNKKAKATIK